MAFADYQTCQQVQAEYQIQYQELDFVPEEWTETSAIFDLDFDFYQTCANTEFSDIAQRELITLPILKELYQNCGGIQGSPAFWVAPYLRADEQLSGTVDYLLATRFNQDSCVIGLPILAIVVQVKQNNFETSWGRCLAALVASDRFNNHIRPVYGIVTNGKTWELGYLHKQLFTKNSTSYTITDLENLFFRLNGFFTLATQNFETAGTA